MPALWPRMLQQANSIPEGFVTSRRLENRAFVGAGHLTATGLGTFLSTAQQTLEHWKFFLWEFSHKATGIMAVIPAHIMRSVGGAPSGRLGWQKGTWRRCVLLLITASSLDVGAQPCHSAYVPLFCLYWRSSFSRDG